MYWRGCGCLLPSLQQEGNLPLRQSVVRRNLRIALALTAVATGATLLALSRPAHAVRAAGVPTLVLGRPYRHRLAPGSRILVRFAPRSLPGGASIDLLAVAASGAVVSRVALRPSRVDRAAGSLAAASPETGVRPAYWIALAPAAGTFPMRLDLAPNGRKRPGTALAAILTGVPAGDEVYLLGELPSRGGSRQIAAYVAPSACIPNPTSGGMVICNFRAPPGYADEAISFEAFSTRGMAASLPFNDLPEAAWPAALPILGLALAVIVKSREVPL